MLQYIMRNNIVSGKHIQSEKSICVIIENVDFTKMVYKFKENFSTLTI